jgi:GNAT superfamily N-acetyltransferase
MKIKILEPGDEELLLEFLQWLTPEALELWNYYGKQFDMKKVKDILADSFSEKVAGIDFVEDLSNPKAYEKAQGKNRIVVFGHLYNLEKDSCRLGIIAGVIGKGYGTKMMKVLIEHAKELGCKKIYLSTYQDNYPALALYKKFDFKIIKKFTDRPRHKYEMVKELV